MRDSAGFVWKRVRRSHRGREIVEVLSDVQPLRFRDRMIPIGIRLECSEAAARQQTD